MKLRGKRTWATIAMVVLFFLAVLVIISEKSNGEGAEEKHEVTDWVKVEVYLADPLPPDRFEIIVTVYVNENGSWKKEYNNTLGELYSKPDSPNSSLVDSGNGTEEGVHLFTEESGDYVVWGGVTQNNRTYWNHTRLNIPPRNTAPVPIALLSVDNHTWTNNLSVKISPGSGITIYLNGSLSYDPDGDPLDYYWDLDDTPPITDLEGKWVRYYFSETGMRKITLTVGDGKTMKSMVIMLNISYDWRPDLTISGTPSIIPSDFQVGDKVEVTAIIHNSGNATAEYFRVYFYDHNLNMSTVRVIDRAEIWELKKNQYHTITFSWNTAGVKRGIHLIEVFIDLEDNVVEENESNNVKWSEKFLVAPGAGDVPILTILNMEISNNTPQVFQMVNITVVVNNSGSARAEWISVILLMNGNEYDSRYLPWLDPGEEASIQFFFSATLIGSYNLTCVLYDNGIEQYRTGKRVVVTDIEGPSAMDDNTLDNQEASSETNYIIIGVGVFMVATAVIIDVIVRMERGKK